MIAFDTSMVMAHQKPDCEAASRLKSAREYLLSRGTCHLNNGEADLAISDLSQFIQDNPDWVAGYFNRANAFDAKKQYDLAIEDYTKALSLSPRIQPEYSGIADRFTTRSESTIWPWRITTWRLN